MATIVFFDNVLVSIVIGLGDLYIAVSRRRDSRGCGRNPRSIGIRKKFVSFVRKYTAMAVSFLVSVRTLACAVALSCAVIGVARAENTVVVELYTSQGCSSCPAADRLLTELRNTPGVLPLTLNVDYWDYLGWKDDLALPGNSKRQRAYARIMRSRNVYTPQMMFDGKMDVIGSRKRDVMAAINAYIAEPDPVSVSVVAMGNGVFQVQAPATALTDQAVIWVVGYDRDVTKAIDGGENHGRTITYSNVVREWHDAGRWSGAAPLNLSVTRPAGEGGVAIIVQQGKVGPILGAAQITY